MVIELNGQKIAGKNDEQTVKRGSGGNRKERRGSEIEKTRERRETKGTQRQVVRDRRIVDTWK